ncbi:BPM2, partial [Symbiodinium sp. KB8]
LCVACILKQHPPSAYAHDAKWCVFSLWLCMMVYPAYYVCKGHGYTKPGDCLVAFTLSMESVVLGWIVCIFQARMVGMRSRHTSGKIDSQIWILVMCGAFFCLSLAIAVNRAVGTNSQEGLIMRICVQSVFLSLWAWYTFDVCRSLWRGLRLLQIETGRVGGLPRRQAHWASKIVCIELLLCMLLGTSTFATWFCITMLKYVQLKDFDAYKDFKATPWGLSLSVMRRLDVVINALSLALLSGILWQDEPPSDGDAETRRRSRSRGLTSMSEHLAVDDKEVYMAVVQQLARRGFRLSSLLDFWERLLEGDDYMPQFDPRRSLTNDVVRQAIIPRSKVGDEGFALASLWSDGQGMLPRTMVTHNWTNTFANLVAGILADAIGCSTYDEIVAQIVTKPGFARVKEDLGEKMDLTYWVCAFSVNQHASICGGFGREPPPYTFEWKAWHAKTCDSVTGEPFTPCTCKMEKIFCHEDNEDPRCELNKFDDMMHHIYVGEKVAGFGQLIVVDNHFEVLYRAWCVAEIVEANVLQIPSRIEVPSQEAVDRNYDRLALLDVRDCSASSPRDKAMILSKIADVAAFNERLLDLVFSSETGLFSKWVDGQERSRQKWSFLPMHEKTFLAACALHHGCPIASERVWERCVMCRQSSYRQTQEEVEAHAQHDGLLETSRSLLLILLGGAEFLHFVPDDEATQRIERLLLLVELSAAMPLRSLDDGILEATADAVAGCHREARHLVGRRFRGQPRGGRCELWRGPVCRCANILNLCKTYYEDCNHVRRVGDQDHHYGKADLQATSTSSPPSLRVGSRAAMSRLPHEARVSAGAVCQFVGSFDRVAALSGGS